MINEKNGQHIHAIQVATGQQSVEEAYLNSLLSPLSINKERDDSVLSESMHGRPAIMAKPMQQPITSHDVKNDSKESDLIEPSSTVTNVAEGEKTETRSQIPFACQLISVAGIKLALPLSSYTRVMPWPGKLIPVKNSQAHLIGHMQYGEGVLNIVDLKRIITNRPIDQIKETGEYPYSNVILLQDGNTCLPCDGISEMVTVDPDKVCWRSSKSQRIWLAGTVKNEGYALLDMEGIMQLAGEH